MTTDTQLSTPSMKFCLRAALHSSRTQDYKLFKTPEGLLYPMIDYFEFMKNPQQALDSWKATYGIKPVKKYRFNTGRRFAYRVCEWPKRNRSQAPQCS